MNGSIGSEVQSINDERKEMQTMKFGTRVMIVAVAGALALVLTGCPQQEGPAEHAGKAVDKAMDKAGEKIEKAGESVQDAAKGEKK